MKKVIVLCVLLCSIGGIFLTGCSEKASMSLEGSNSGENYSPQNRNIGIYDSRCIAIAYYNSDIHNEYMNQIAAKHKDAKAAGDDETAKSFEKQMEEMQKQAHYQGFGTASVDNLLEKVKDDLEIIKAERNLDLVISKWDYEGDQNKCVDITDELVELYNPSAKALKWIEQAKEKKPIPQDKLEKMDHSH